MSRALRNLNKTPVGPNRPQFLSTHSSDRIPFTHYDFNKRFAPPDTDDAAHSHPSDDTQPLNPQRNRPERPLYPPQDRRTSLTVFAHSPPIRTLQPFEERGESDPSSDSDDDKNSPDKPPLRNRPRYGSIVGSPPKDIANLSRLELPDPALDPSVRNTPHSNDDPVRQSIVSKPTSLPQDPPPAKSPRGPRRKLSNLPKKIFRPKRKNQPSSSPFDSTNARPGFTGLQLDSPNVPDIQVQLYQTLDARQDDFFSYLDKELDKIEKFYQQKEDEATARLQLLREQLHEMRDRRIDDLQTAKAGGQIANDGLLDGQVPVFSTPYYGNGSANGHARHFLKPVTDMISSNGRIGKTSKAMQRLSSPPGPKGKDHAQNNDKGDYVRRQPPIERVPYRFAKRRLKLALQEFYRGLELLKSYVLLNRTAFRKINKKYDKAVMARPPLHYMSEKVNNSHFVRSTVIEGHLVAVEDLYARYFERGNRKVAINKLRSHLRGGDYSSVAFRNGLYVAAGVGFAITAIVNGVPALFSSDAVLKTQTSYLFQLYGGYFLSVLLFLLFVLDCRIWTRARINYIFVFEYDTRHVLDWRQLAELPCFFLFLNGLFLWLNFQFNEAHPMYLYWPVVLIGLTVLIIFFPIKIIYYRARKWWMYSNFRLLLAGLYPVEFRDFYLGDMYCSETYSMSQIELFFCLYAHKWNNPAQCNSNHSMLLGFFTTLPAVWRALQCLRRYYDSRNWFPHLANFAKYCGNILYYMTLSLYRLHLTPERKAVFMVFAAFNGIYCSFWDVFMDFSLGNPWSKNFLLRDHLAYRRRWVYYVAMVVDIVLRQQWILYAIFTVDLQHSAAMSFFVALAEVLRRGMWSLFRVENEHCNNVEKFRASRDVPLPYSISASERPSVDLTSPADRDRLHKVASKTATRAQESLSSLHDTAQTTSADLERARTNTTTSSARQRRSPFAPSTPGLRALQRVTTVIAAAHSQDFEKRRRHAIVGTQSSDEDANRAQSSEEEDNDAEDTEREYTRLSNERREDISSGVSTGVGIGTRTSNASASGSGGGRRTAGARRARAETLSTPHAEEPSEDPNEADAMEINEARDRIERAKGPRD